MQEHSSPEPMRPMFDSDESHAVAWLQWAASTPGGWSARLADKSAVEPVPDHVPPAWTADARPPDPSPADAYRHGTELVRYVRAKAPCCQADVIVDPVVAFGARGICSTCAGVLDYVHPGWGRRPPDPPA